MDSLCPLHRDEQREPDKNEPSPMNFVSILLSTFLICVEPSIDEAAGERRSGKPDTG